MSGTAYDEAVERVAAAKARGALATITAPGWVLAARTVCGPLESSIVAVRDGRLDDGQYWLDHAWQAIKWSHEDYARDYARL